MSLFDCDFAFTAYAAQVQMAELQMRIQMEQMKLEARPVSPITKRAPNKCPSCGSREFKEHGGQTICAFCRSSA